MDPKNITKEYSNGEVTIVWKSGLCQHAAECVRNNPEVFKPREKPWINPENSTTEKIIETVKKCPSGALTHYLNS
ncbi:MAG: (4Fe-4S)-binding protein [Flavobacteriaceae bacterium]